MWTLKFWQKQIVKQLILGRNEGPFNQISQDPSCVLLEGLNVKHLNYIIFIVTTAHLLLNYFKLWLRLSLKVSIRLKRMFLSWLLTQSNMLFSISFNTISSYSTCCLWHFTNNSHIIIYWNSYLFVYYLILFNIISQILSTVPGT